MTASLGSSRSGCCCHTTVRASRAWDGSAAGVGGTQPRAALAESFIDKSIQVRFEVPLPLLSDWRAYLESTLRSALPDCGEANGYMAYRMYAHRVANAGQAPSPREVKQYVNRIGALHRRWQHELASASLATNRASMPTEYARSMSGRPSSIAKEPTEHVFDGGLRFRDSATRHSRLGRATRPYDAPTTMTLTSFGGLVVAGSRSALALIFGFMAFEVVSGWLAGSLALLAHAGHMLADSGGLGLALIATLIAQREASAQRTWGYYRVEVLAVLVNAGILMVVGALILFEAYNRPSVGEIPTLMVAMLTPIPKGCRSSWSPRSG